MIDPGPARPRTWRVTRWLIRVLLFRFFRVRIIGEDRLRIERRLIVAPTHRSNLDSPLLGGAVSRNIRALSKESLFANRLFGWYIGQLGAFPVKRGAADRESMRVARELLAQDEPLLVFPEGSRRTGDEIGELFDGTSYLAAKAQAPILVVGIAGTEGALPAGAKRPRRTTVTMVVGDELAPPPLRAKRRELTEHTAAIRAALADAYDRARSDVAERTAAA